jgi:hypothetical protein
VEEEDELRISYSANYRGERFQSKKFKFLSNDPYSNCSNWISSLGKCSLFSNLNYIAPRLYLSP